MIATVASHGRIGDNVTRPAAGRHPRGAASDPLDSPLVPRLPAAVISIALAATALAACNDLRDFRGDWSGPRVGDNPSLRVGVNDGATAHLVLDRVDRHGLAGTLAVDGLIAGAALASLPGAEADALAGLSFDGAPLRIYLGFVATLDAGGDALAMVALYDDDRLEVRVLRGGARPIYGIFALKRTPS